MELTGSEFRTPPMQNNTVPSYYAPVTNTVQIPCQCGAKSVLLKTSHSVNNPNRPFLSCSACGAFAWQDSNPSILGQRNTGPKNTGFPQRQHHPSFAETVNARMDSMDITLNAICEQLQEMVNWIKSVDPASKSNQ